MTAVYASTSPAWFESTTRLAPTPMEVAFWRPSDKHARRITAGDPWFFKEWGAPRILGLGRFVRYEKTTPTAIWDQYGAASGASSFDELLAVIAAARGERPTDANTPMGNVVLTDFSELPAPVPLAAVGLDDLHVAFAYVPEGSQVLGLAAKAPLPLLIIPLSPASRRELETEVFARNEEHVAYVRKLYGGRCQVTGLPVLEGIAGDLTHVHHIDFLCNDGPDDPSNMMALSPDWHAVAHATGTMFDWGSLEFVVAGRRYGLALNRHLVPRPR
jgi:hypothetical protein